MSVALSPAIVPVLDAFASARFAISAADGAAGASPPIDLPITGGGAAGGAAGADVPAAPGGGDVGVAVAEGGFVFWAGAAAGLGPWPLPELCPGEAGLFFGVLILYGIKGQFFTAG